MPPPSTPILNQDVDLTQYIQDATRLFKDFLVAFDSGSLKNPAGHAATRKVLLKDYNLFLLMNGQERISDGNDNRGTG